MAEDGGLDLIKLTTEKLSTDTVSASVSCSSCGAISLFIGKVMPFGMDGIRLIVFLFDM